MKPVKLVWADNSANDYPNLQKDLELATETALRYVRGALYVLYNGYELKSSYRIDKGKKHFERFFGAFDDGRYTTVIKAFKDIHNELSTRQMTYYVSKENLDSKKLYGSSQENQADGNINIFGLYLKAPLLGQDSKYGVIIHETSHNVIDHISDQNATYSLAETEALARKDPERATHCAESYEYYVEFGVASGLITPVPDPNTSTGWVDRGGDIAPPSLSFPDNYSVGDGKFRAWAGTGKGSYLDRSSGSPHPVRDADSNWVGENMRSRWLDAPADKTTFSVMFNINNSVDLDTNMIRGRWAVDDEGEMYHVDPQTRAETLVSKIGAPGYGHWTEFVAGTQHGLKHGTNEFRFYIRNAGGGPGGLRVETEKFQDWSTT
jgi:hypothetical protein